MALSCMPMRNLLSMQKINDDCYNYEVNKRVKITVSSNPMTNCGNNNSKFEMSNRIIFSPLKSIMVTPIDLFSNYSSHYG